MNVTENNSNIKINSVATYKKYSKFSLVLFFSENGLVFSKFLTSYTPLNTINLRNFGIYGPITLSNSLVLYDRNYIAFVAGFNIYICEILISTYLDVYWDIRIRKILKEHNNKITCLFSDFNWNLYSGDENGKLVVWNYQKKFSVSGYVEIILQHEKGLKIILPIELFDYLYCITVTTDELIHIWNNNEMIDTLNLTKFGFSSIIGVEKPYMQFIVIDGSGKIGFFDFFFQQLICLIDTKSKIASYKLLLFENIYTIQIDGTINLWQKCQKTPNKTFNLATKGRKIERYFDIFYENLYIFGENLLFEIWNISQQTFVQNNLCYTGCPQGQYLNYYYICLNCQENCENCLYSKNNCIECKKGLVLGGGNCFDKCPLGTYLENGVCKCPKGYYLNNTKCLPCSKGCLECKNYNYNCTQCKNGYYLQNYINGIKYCNKCLEGCEFCESLSLCDKCKSGFYINKVNK